MQRHNAPTAKARRRGSSLFFKPRLPIYRHGPSFGFPWRGGRPILARHGASGTPRARRPASDPPRTGGGSGGVVCLTGEAGVGKTALARAFAAQAGVRVLWGACEGLRRPRLSGPSTTGRDGWLAVACTARRQRPACHLFRYARRARGGADARRHRGSALGRRRDLDLVRFLGSRLAGRPDPPAADRARRGPGRRAPPPRRGRPGAGRPPASRLACRCSPRPQCTDGRARRPRRRAPSITPLAATPSSSAN